MSISRRLPGQPLGSLVSDTLIDLVPTACPKQVIGFAVCFLTTGADLANLINQAAIRGSASNSSSVSLGDLEFAKDRILMGGCGSEARREGASHTLDHIPFPSPSPIQAQRGRAPSSGRKKRKSLLITRGVTP